MCNGFQGKVRPGMGKYRILDSWHKLHLEEMDRQPCDLVKGNTLAGEYIIFQGICKDGNRPGSWQSLDQQKTL